MKYCRCIISTSFFCVAMVFAGAASSADEAAATSTNRAFALEGNWFVTWEGAGPDGANKAAALTLTKPYQRVCQSDDSGGCRWINVRSEDQPWSLSGAWSVNETYYPLNPTVSDQDRLSIKHPYGVLGDWGGYSDVQLSDQNTIRGEWKYGDRSGPEIWRKAISTVKEVLFSEVNGEVLFEASRGRVEGTYDPSDWGPANDMRGNRPTFWIEIHGDNLWGHHLIDFGGEPGLEPLDYAYIYKDQAGYAPDNVIGLQLNVVVWENAVPGTKSLYLDGIRIPFDFAVHGHPSPFAETRDAEPALQSVEIVGPEPPYNPIKLMPVGKHFVVKVEFKDRPKQGDLPAVVKVRNPAREDQIIEVKADRSTDDPLVFLTDPIFVSPVDIPALDNEPVMSLEKPTLSPKN